MDKKSSKPKDLSALVHSSAGLIDRIFNRFKFSKRKPSSITMNGDPVSHFQFDPQIMQITKEECSKITPPDLEPLAEELEKFVQYLQGLQELSFSVYKYPSELQNRLERSTNELDSIYREVHAASLNAQRLKQQRKVVNKEIRTERRRLQKLRYDESREIEDILQIYDKQMFTRWENLKNTRKPDLLKSLQFDVHSKQDALEGLNTLIQKKLTNLNPGLNFADFAYPFSKDKYQSAEASLTCRRGSIAPQRPFRQDYQTFNDINSIVHPTDEVFNNVTRNRISPRRRKAPDNQSRMGSDRVAFGPAQDVTTVTVATLAPPVGTVTPVSSVSDRSLDTSSSGSVSAITPPGCDSNSDTHAAIGFSSEMQSVLQALFTGMHREDGGLNSIEAITVDGDDTPTGSITPTNENQADENHVVQLFSLQSDSQDNEPSN